MKKEHMLYRISYSKKEDAFSTWVYVGKDAFPDWDEFGLEAEFPCIQGFLPETGATGRKDFVHYELVTRIRQAIDLGFKVSFHSRPEN